MKESIAVMKIAPLGASLALVLACSPPIMADQITTFKLDNVSWGGSATGTFTYDFTTDHLVSVAVLANGSIPFSNTFSYPTSITRSSFDGSYDYQQVSYNLAFVFDTPLTPTTGSTITLDPTQSYFSVDLSGNGGGVTNFPITSGSIDPVLSVAAPEPSTLRPLLLGILLTAGAASLLRASRLASAVIR